MSVRKQSGSILVMKNHPLPLQTLRAFEASARTLSFTLAARELNLSQSAISQQIKRLEDHLNRLLFVRLTRQLELTKEGEYFFAKVSQSIRQIDHCAKELINRKNEQDLTIVATPSINAQWLVRKLQKFRALFPQIKLSVYEGISPLDINQYKADVGLFYGDSRATDYEIHELYHDVLFPVSNRTLIKKHALKTPSDLQSCQLLTDADSTYNHWSEWFHLAKLQTFLSSNEINFDNMSHMISAAKQGQGVALVRDKLVEQELAEGSLVRLFDIEFQPPFKTFLAVNKNSFNKESVNFFKEWLTACFKTS